MKKIYKQRIKLWIDALRSGKYVKTIGNLRSQREPNEYVYCALGVACQIYENETSDKLPDDEWNLDLPKSYIAHWFGFTDSLMYFKANGFNPKIELCGTTVSEANDCDDMSFFEIANKIEKMYLKKRWIFF